MPTKIKGQPASAEIIDRLKKENRPVLVSFSLGKDAIATELALQDAGVETVLCYLYYVPRSKDGVSLEFIDETIGYFEAKWGKPIHRYPHPAIYHFLNHLIFQPPERIQTIEDAQLPEITYDKLWPLIKDDLGLPQDTWIADGVRAADSIVRRASFVTHGLMKSKSRKVSPIADYLKAEVLEIIERHDIDLPIDYDLFGRSFDGIDYRFTKPLLEKRPADYERLKHWYPMLDIDIFRHEQVWGEK